MDCHDARLLLTLQRREPEQLDAAEANAVEAHVDSCPGCQSWSRGKARFDAAVASAMQSVSVPAGLKGKINARLAATRRSAWRQPRIWAAVAAVLLLAVGGAGTFVWMQAEPFNVETYFITVPFHDDLSPQGVQDFFGDLGYEMTPPPNFRNEYLRDYKLVRFQGHVVPRLTFRRTLDNGDVVTAHVYCLSPRQFRYDGRSLQGISPDRQGHVIVGDHDLYFVDCVGDLSLLRQLAF